MSIQILISAGELVDRITILRIKRARISDPAKTRRVQEELNRLEPLLADLPDTPGLDALTGRLHALNAELWDIEDAKRRCEAEQRFDDAFVDLARRVYLRNDDRAALKRAIDVLTGSEPGEVKSHG